MKLSNFFALSFSLLLTISLVNNKAIAKEKIKCAIIAPKGSTWMNVLEEWDKELKKRTNGELSFKFYPSGSMGDEKTVLRKMRSGQLDAGAFTGVGLGEIVPEVRLMEIPFMFSSYKEIDYVLDRMTPIFNKKFEEKGFKNLGWAETGFVHIFSNKPIRSFNDLNGIKMWMWEGDKLVEEIYKELKLVPTPLAVQDVLTSLQTGLIDGVYAPPLGAIALQWTSKVKYMVEPKMTYATGAMLVTEKTWNSLDPSMKKILEETAKIYTEKLVSEIRKENEKAKSSIKASGIVFTNPDSDTVSRLKTASMKVANSLVGSFYSKDLLEKVRKLKNEVK
jgi:TRAP-type C4-dicarboxylate transport system substrate-binding protein